MGKGICLRGGAYVDKLDGYLDEYREKFGEIFPMMQAENMEKALEHVKVCISKNKLASELYPEIYGALPDKFV